jgi:hypothetical protein
MNTVYRLMDLFHAFSLRKIILKVSDKPQPLPFYILVPYFILFIFWSLQFYKNMPELFQNYILVPIILHLGP